MSRKEIQKLQNNAPIHYQNVNAGVDFSRREFFKLAGLGVTGFFLSQVTTPLEVVAQSSPTLINTAKNCIFIHLTGAPSHLDTFDLKEGAWTPKDFQPTTVGNIRWPVGLMPKMADHLNKVGLVRSMNAWALVHQLAQVWTEIGRNPASGLSKIAPNIGAVVAYEYESRRTSTQKLPGFIALNTNGALQQQGYFAPEFAPFVVTASATGLTNATHPEGEDLFKQRYAALQSLDASLRSNPAPFGSGPSTMATTYSQAREMMYNSDVQKVFTFDTADSQRYGNNGFGNSCIVARNILQSDSGTHFVQINFGNWDHHQNIYNTNGGIYTMTSALDAGLANLLTDLATSTSKSGKSLLDETLVVVMGEFGRTPGALNNQGGRDHYMQMSALFAGAGVKGNTVIGKTDDTGAGTIEYGWSRDMLIRPEDVFSSIYSALGIDYTKVLTNDPFNRGFEYVPYAKDGGYAPIQELWF
ncbi:MAG TPA: DUF1501 domain-containing protein [Acidobacteriota bacterium]|nr:DUF1501 domain-containing protein [Acidobacteriota bacterium]